jgi:hypothetical protein
MLESVYAKAGVAAVGTIVLGLGGVAFGRHLLALIGGSPVATLPALTVVALPAAAFWLAGGIAGEAFWGRAYALRAFLAYIAVLLLAGSAILSWVGERKMAGGLDGLAFVRLAAWATFAVGVGSIISSIGASRGHEASEGQAS